MDRLEVAIDLAKEAGKMASRFFEGPFSVRDKGSGKGPVTEADLEIDRFVVTKLRQTFSKDSVVSEESEPFEGSSGYTWYLDPIDGTKDFVRREKGWSIMIGCASPDGLSLGVVHAPEYEEVFFASKGRGATLELPDGTRTRLKCRETTLASAILAVSKSHPSKRVEKLASELSISERLESGSVGLKLCRIAQGKADLYFNFSKQCSFWDTCAGDIVLKEAGGEVKLASGELIAYGNSKTFSIEDTFFAGGPGLVDPVLAQYSKGLNKTQERRS